MCSDAHYCIQITQNSISQGCDGANGKKLYKFWYLVMLIELIVIFTDKLLFGN